MSAVSTIGRPVKEQMSLPTGQQSLPGLCAITQAVEILATKGGIEARGAIFTRREVVEFLLDLCGYSSDRPLHTLKLLEPSFGGGDFLLPAVERLLTAWKAAGKAQAPVKALSGCICAVELHRSTFEQTRAEVITLLSQNGIEASHAVELTDTWLINQDFLLADLPNVFDVVIGNPPYVRQERVPDVLLAEYRSRYTTIYDRADLYIPFIERSLRSLTDGGVLGFICADRWMKNRYGGPLRNLVSEQFHLKVYVDMVDTPAFHSEVIAYPAITVIARERGKRTRIAHRPPVEGKALRSLALELSSPHLPSKGSAVQVIDGVASGAEPWILDSSDQLAVIRRLEAALPLLEETGCKVGIGVATGADKAFIGPMDELAVEEDRKLPLVMTKDIADGTVKWRGLGVINPFADEGGLVEGVALAEVERGATTARLGALREVLRADLVAAFGDRLVVHTPSEAAPHILSVSFRPDPDPLDGEMLLAALDLDGVSVSAGSACTSGALEPSHVLLAMGVERDTAGATVRFSLGHPTTSADVADAVASLTRIVARLDAVAA